MLRDEVRLPGQPFSFDGRNRRPPLDAVNCLLSYTYALLTKDLTATAFGVGFDPYMGFYHRPRFGRPALALDLAEEFRPLLAESVVLSLINNGEIRGSHFVVRAGGVMLTADGRRAVLAGYERRLDAEVRHPTFGYTITYRRVLDVQARVLAAHLLGEIPAYIAFTTR
jgi:CRISPR-associated protein Cas1